MSLAAVHILQEGGTVEELLARPPTEWLKPGPWHPTDGVGLLNGTFLLKSEITGGKWVIKTQPKELPLDATIPAIKESLTLAMRIWKTACANHSKPRRLKFGFQWIRMLLGNTPDSEPPLPNPALDVTVKAQRAQLAELESLQKLELNSFPIRRKTAFNEARAAEVAVGGPRWKDLQLRWDDLKAKMMIRQEAEIGAMKQSHLEQRMNFEPQWRSPSLELREMLLRAHLEIYHALVFLPGTVRDQIIPELNLDYLDTDESLLSAFHRRYDAIQNAVTMLSPGK